MKVMKFHEGLESSLGTKKHSDSGGDLVQYPDPGFLSGIYWQIFGWNFWTGGRRDQSEAQRKINVSVVLYWPHGSAVYRGGLRSSIASSYRLTNGQQSCGLSNVLTELSYLE